MAISALVKGIVGDGENKKQTGANMAQKMLPSSSMKEPASVSPVQKSGAIVKVKDSQIVQARPVRVDNKKEDIADTGINPLDAAFAGLGGAINSLKSVIGEKFKFEKKDNQQKARKRENLLRFLKNKGLALVGGAIGVAKAIDEKLGFFEKLKKFFVNVLLGGILVYISKNWQKLVDWWEETKKELEPFFDKLKTWILDPLFKFVKWIGTEGIKLTKKVLAFEPIQKSIDAIKEKLKEVTGLELDLNEASKALPKDLTGSAPPGAQPGGGYQPAAAPSAVAQDMDFQAGVTALAKKYNLDEDDLYAVMSFETGGTFDPAQKNLAGSGATGLIQFMPSTARGLGTTTDELAKMTRTQQLAYVDKYFSNKGIEGGNIDDLYMAILFPAAVGKPDDFVLFGKGAMSGYTGVAYDQNKGLDANKDGSVTKAEAAASARKHKGRKPRPSAPPAAQPSGGGIIEHLHGDPGRAGYEYSGHGRQSNAHDHFAFASKDLRIAVQNALAAGEGPSGRKWQIGSTTGGKHADGSYHYSGQAFDIPWSQFGSGAIGQSDYQQSRTLKADVDALVQRFSAAAPRPAARPPAAETITPDQTPRRVTVPVPVPQPQVSVPSPSSASPSGGSGVSERTVVNSSFRSRFHAAMWAQ